MAASPEPEVPAADEAPKGKLASKLTVILAVVGGIAAGAAAGAFAVGPLVAQKLAPHAASADSARADAGDEEPAEDAKGEAATRPVHTIDNLVLNPAESGGQRFLLLTIAFELKDAETLDQLKARDAELRDVVLQTVGAKSVQFLADMATRDSLKSELRTVAGQLFPEKRNVVRRIYFPQFVIQ